MKKLLFLCCLAGLLSGAVEARQRAQGYCQQGGQAVVVSGLTGHPSVQASYPNCTVKVFFSGLSGPVSISTLTRSSNVVTVVMSAPITNLSLNALAVIVGASDSSFNGSFTVTSVTQAANTFTFNQTGTDGSTAGGTATFTPSLFSDNAGTSLSNPFTASSVGLWFFYTENSRYDIQLSGGGIVSPFTIGDVLVSDPAGSTTAFVGVPVPPCTATQTAVNILTGDFYSCIGGVFIKVGPGGNPGVLVSPVITPNPLNLDVNVGFKGPNPYVDATRFGVRAVLGGATPPQSPGITVSCTSGSPSVTISSATTFVNGDGVALYGCGAGTIGAPAAPIVTHTLQAAQTGLLLDVPGVTGATTRCYQLVARSFMGATNVSPETCDTTGPASLGLQTNTITTVSLVNNVATYTTSAAHGLAAGALAVVQGTAVNTINGQAFGQAMNPFDGWFKVATVPDNTHFTVNLSSDARNGAIPAGTGGTLNYWNSIHIKATETTNNYIYYVYGRVTGGTKTLIGAMWPQDVNLPGRLTDPTYLVFDDLGSTVTTFPNPPYYIPTTVPSTPTKEMLSTTIVSGAGTTSLVLANNAGNTISGQTILFDDAVTFLAGVTYAANLAGNTAGTLMLPDPGNNLLYMFNSPITIAPHVSVEQKGTVWLNEPISMSNVVWYGDVNSSDGSPAFGNIVTIPIYFDHASPGFFLRGACQFKSLQWIMQSGNGALAYIQESGGIPGAGAFRDLVVTLTTGLVYSNMGMVFRGDGAGYDFTNAVVTSSQNGNLIATGPAMYFNGITNVRFSNLNQSGVGAAAFRPPPAGGFLIADNVYCQGCYTPYFSLVRNSTDSSALFNASVRQVVFDTTSVPLFANYGGHALTLDLSESPSSTINQVTGSDGRNNLIFSGSANVPLNVGTSVLNGAYAARDGTFGGTTLPIDLINKSVSIGQGYSLFTTTGYYPAPTCPVSAGGSVPVGTIYYTYVPIFPNGSEGTPSFVCAATTTGGNQTVTLNWPAIPGVTQYNAYRGLGVLSNNGLISCSPLSSPTYIDTAASGCGGGGASQAAGGPAGLKGGFVWAQTYRFGTDEPFTNAPRGTLTAFFPGALTSTWTATTWSLTKPITVMSGTVQVKTAPVGCSPNAVIRITDGVTFADTTITAASNSFGSLPFWGAPNSLTVTVQTAAAGCGTPPADANLVMEYRTR